MTPADSDMIALPRGGVKDSHEGTRPAGQDHAPRICRYTPPFATAAALTITGYWVWISRSEIRLLRREICGEVPRVSRPCERHERGELRVRQVI